MGGAIILNAEKGACVNHYLHTYSDAYPTIGIRKFFLIKHYSETNVKESFSQVHLKIYKKKSNFGEIKIYKKIYLIFLYRKNWRKKSWKKFRFWEDIFWTFLDGINYCFIIRYSGQWENGVKQGKASYTFASGDVFEGNYVNNQRHGPGKLTKVDGEIREENWKEDKLVNFNVVQEAKKK